MSEEAASQAPEMVAGWPVDSKGNVIVTLTYPIKLEYIYPHKASKHPPGQEPTANTVTCRRIKAKDLRAASAAVSDFEVGYQLAIAVTGLADDDFEKIDAADLGHVMGVVNALQKKSARQLANRSR